jgi:hypothetical protein
LIERPEWNDTRFIFTNTNLAIPKVGAHFATVTGSELHEVWPGIFRRFFQPSEPVAKIIDYLAEEQGLIPGQYSSAHVRAKFPVGKGEIKMIGRSEAGLNMNDATTHEIITRVVDNAVHCAMKAMPEATHVYFAADAHEATTYLLEESPTWAVQHGNFSPHLIQKSSVTIVTRPNYTVEPAHFEFVMDGDPRKYYGIIIDLWIMAHAKCMAQGVGGFGHFASNLSGNHYSCRVRHRDYTTGAMPSCPTPGAELRAPEERQGRSCDKGRRGSKSQNRK